MNGVLRQGNGPTLVLQHGFLSGAEYWQQTIDRLSVRFDVIALDLPGFANRCNETAIDSIPGFVEDLLAHLDSLGVNRFHLCGHSMGGMIAQELAITAPERLNRLILYATGPDGSMPGRFETIDASLKKIKQNTAAAILPKTVSSWFLKETNDSDFPAALSLAQKASADAIMGGFNAMKSWRSLGRLDQIKCKTLILWPDKDRSYRWQHPLALWQGIEDVSLAVIPGCAHNAHLEKPDYFCMIVEDFLNQAL